MTKWLVFVEMRFSYVAFWKIICTLQYQLLIIFFISKLIFYVTASIKYQFPKYWAKLGQQSSTSILITACIQPIWSQPEFVFITIWWYISTQWHNEDNTYIQRGAFLTYWFQNVETMCRCAARNLSTSRSWLWCCCVCAISKDFVNFHHHTSSYS